jgi:cellulose synthase/poly-beta-1,6-N-acetylglucosamine synthase-like glycosyltransferase
VLATALRIWADGIAFGHWQHQDHGQLKKRVSIIIPVLNEEGSLPGLFVALNELDPQPSQIIFVDGGSTDRHAPFAHACFYSCNLLWVVLS